jgi:hypothetical protein
MPYEESQSHLSDQDLARAADGELSPKADFEIRAHLASCSSCRARMNEMEAAIAGFVCLHRDDLDAKLPPVAGPRALLRARLAGAAGQPAAGSATGFFGLLFPHISRKYVMAASAAVFLVTVAIALREATPARGEAVVAPKARLTPGATVPLTREDVCRGNSLTEEPPVPAFLKRQVFEEYGIPDAQPDAYEVDYLITPQLGGATNIRNLWPQPYFNTTWHARVKDQLEERLHAMVCNGEIDLATAQHDIATNWIAAYKKYFHTEKPLVGRSQLHKRVIIREAPPGLVQAHDLHRPGRLAQVHADRPALSAKSAT